MNDPRIIGQRPADEDRCGGLNTLTRFADEDACTPGNRCPMCGGNGGYYDVCDYHVTERGA